MSDPHHPHHDPIEENIETHPVKLAIGVAIGAVALVVGLLLLAEFAVGLHGSRSMKDDPAMSDAAVRKRLAPVAAVDINPNAPPPAPAAPTPVAAVIPPPAAKAGTAAASGKGTYDAVCHVCHGAGVAGAPKTGDKTVWSARMKAGVAALHASALKGKGAMPPKGGNPAISDADVKAAVDYMLAASR